MSDVKMSDQAYVADGAFLTDNDGEQYRQVGTELYKVNFEQRDEQGSVVGFSDANGHEYLVDGDSVIYRRDE